MADNLLIFTGPGKGKTSAAIGTALRSLGHGRRLLVIQFIKNQPSGELQMLQQLGVAVEQFGLGFVPPVDSPAFADHCRIAQQGWQRATEAMNSGVFDLLVLDELCVALDKGLLDEKQVLQGIRDSWLTTLILTGRNAGKDLIALADTVSEIICLKHALQDGLQARQGIEF